MAVFNGTFKSKKLGMDTQVVIILPQDQSKVKELKILYLLHGLSDNATAWTRFTQIERYAIEKGFIVIMPEVQRSFYTNMIYGRSYFDYITEELPSMCEKMFGIQRDRTNTFIAGLSMGGYGALKCALRCMDQYAAVASFSGVCNLKERIQDTKKENDLMLVNEWVAIMGEDLKLDESDDLFDLASVYQTVSQKPEILLTCGLEDFLYQDNKTFRNHLELLGYDPKYLEWEGDHNWKFWDTSIEIAMDFFEHLKKS